MNHIFFVLIVLLFVVLAIVVGRRIRTLKTARLARAATPDQTAPEAQPVLAQRFRTWSQQAFATEPTLVAWLNTLNESALQAFTDEIAAFTQEAHIDLSWLLDQDLSHHPVTRRQLTAMLSHYCQAWYQAVSAQQEVRVLQTWDKFNRNPYAPAHQPLLQALWTQLVEHQLTPPPAEMLTVPASEQPAYKLQLIRNVVQREPVPFYALLPDAIATAQRAPAVSLTQRVEQVAQRLWAFRPARNGAGPETAVPQPKEKATGATS